VNDLDFLLRVVDRLRSEGVRTWVCGGWGEELRGLQPPRPHRDVDLLYPGRDWARVDGLELDWIPGKRADATRAFVIDAVMVKLTLVERDECGWFTRSPQHRHDWPDDVFSTSGRLPVASAAALAGHRRSYRPAA
jgi:aminoglycoside-2''-adenylyltransferase